MTLMTWLLLAWGLLTAALVVLLIYRSTLTMHEDDQLFLDESEQHMQREQMELMAKLDKINPFVKWLSAASGIGIIALAAVFVYQGLVLPQ
jgi:hypothetical protein